jgi:hypothetical protein
MKKIIFAALIAMHLAPSAMADTIYTYTGNDYTICGGTYCSGGPYALSAMFDTTLMGNALDNLSFTDITTTVTSFKFTDGSGLTLNKSSATYSDIEIATNASGNVTAWFVGAYANSANTQMQTNLNSPHGFIPGADFSETTANFAGNYGFVPANPGTWTISSVPEPETYAMLLAGLGLIGFITYRRKSDSSSMFMAA